MTRANDSKEHGNTQKFSTHSQTHQRTPNRSRKTMQPNRKSGNNK